MEASSSLLIMFHMFLFGILGLYLSWRSYRQSKALSAKKDRLKVLNGGNTDVLSVRTSSPKPEWYTKLKAGK
jgi:hypothetical protein